MELAAITSKIIEYLENNTTEVENIGSQPGLVNDKDSILLTNQFPAIRIVPKLLKPTQQDIVNTQEYEATYVLYYLNQAKDDWAEDMLALNTMDKLLRLIKSNNWGLSILTPAANVIAEVLSIKKMDSKVISGWKVEWNHLIHLPHDTPSTLTSITPENLYISTNRDDFGIAEKYNEVSH